MGFSFDALGALLLDLCILRYAFHTFDNVVGNID